MTDKPTMISADAFFALPVDDKVDYRQRGAGGYEFAPLGRVINAWLYGRLSAAKKAKFQYDPAARRYRRHEI